MVRNSVTTTDSDDDDTTSAFSAAVHSIRDRFPFKRNPVNHNHNESNNNSIASISRLTSKTLPYSHKPSRSHHHRPLARKLELFFFERKSRLLCIILVIFLFAIATMVLQSSMMSVLRQGVTSETMRWRWSVKEDLKLGSSLEFVPRPRFHLNGSRLHWLRNQLRIGIRHPRIGLILGNMKKDPSTLMMYTLMKNLKGIGYLLKIYAIEDGNARPIWEEIGGQVSILSPERYGYIDWSIFEGIIADSLEVKDAISSLMQEPFCSVPLIWIIQEDTLANRLPLYKSRGWDFLISNWTNAFHRADVVVFPDFSLPMLYSALDTGNFYVIPGSPVDVYTAESYSASHYKFQLREENGFDKDVMLVLVIGSSFFYNELVLDYSVSMHDIEPLLIEYAGLKDVGETFKFVFLCGNSSSGYNDALQDLATRLGLPHGSLRHYGIDNDVNGLILMADIILYGSSQDEQGFPPLLTRAMSFGVPVVAPDYPVIKKYVVDGVHGIIFQKHDARALLNAFSTLIYKGKLSDDAQSIALSGKSLVKNMLAAECITGYARLLENAFNFPSDVLLPVHISELKQASWEWSLFKNEIEQKSSNTEYLSSGVISSIVDDLEEEMSNLVPIKNISGNDIEDLEEDIPTVLDWDILREIESSEEVERLETQEIEERMEKDIGVWDEIYRTARKAEKLKFEMNERDEGELERTGQPVCIYEIYNGAGGWPFLHHGSLYRGLSLLTRSRRMRSDDVDAVGRLPILNDTYYRDILCETGGMFALANGVDNIHKRPWIGFQSWRAAGRKVSLSKKAEQVLEQAMQEKTVGDVVYFWARTDMDGGHVESNDLLTFWSMCDIMNGGKCRTAFENAFRLMYALPSNIEALPPMPEDGGHWSALHSWVMPTPSFLEFVMFSRMFVDSLNCLHVNSSTTSDCLLGFTSIEKQHCYCRLLELLVNVWAYHSARKMVYIDPQSGLLEEQHPIEQRKGFMWAKYFNITLLKSMDEDLAEAADDNDHPYETWLWPLTGEVYWQGIYEREREERYRLKMDKKRKTKEKLFERQKYGYKQKTLGG
ncbi:unnamed protein product [Fraxinus pennsylvanica]|uniref:Glycosyl transferase family 1 domain-containing protein n=1 Tax=Fraxinus pennsylvanica TaxID=56036 RepID=A0AAD1ZEI5_9LAMI|nr:unnamed protein product [Fraxinus pennsylvanica]